MSLLGHSGTVPVYQFPDNQIHFTGGCNCDADGGRHAYHPGNTGLDTLANARDGKGGWCGLVTDSAGHPVIQGLNDPAPGYYVSQTTYVWPGFAATDPRRYVNAETVPFAVFPGWLRRLCRGILLGCAGHLTDLATGKSIDLVAADSGPAVGEYSIAALRGLGVNSSPRTGGDGHPGFHCVLYPGRPAVIDGLTYPLIRA